MSREVEDLNRPLLRARDAMDRAYAEPLDVRAVAAVAYVSEAHFIRSFRSVFGETPHRYLQRRRVERSRFLLRETDRGRPRPATRHRRRPLAHALAAALLALLMVFAAVFHLRRDGEGMNAAASLVLVALAAFVVYGRLVLAPYV